MATGKRFLPDRLEQPQADREARPPPTTKRGRPAALEPLSVQQRQFATENHDLIYAFLRERQIAVGDYYDIAAFGYLHAVQRYLTVPGLKRFRFSTIAWKAMRQSIASFHRAEARRKETERRYAESINTADDVAYENLEARLFLHDLAAAANEEQYALAELRLQGYSIAEVALSQGMSPKRVRRLLREMYQVYLRLYSE